MVCERLFRKQQFKGSLLGHRKPKASPVGTTKVGRDGLAPAMAFTITISGVYVYVCICMHVFLRMCIDEYHKL